jgi:hypothetical protein
MNDTDFDDVLYYETKNNKKKFIVVNKDNIKDELSKINNDEFLKWEKYSEIRLKELNLDNISRI